MNKLISIITNNNELFWNYVRKNQKLKTCIFTLFILSRFRTMNVLIKMLKKAYIKYYYQQTLKNRFGNNAWAVITGGSEGIGKQYAEQLSQLGVNIFIISINEEQNLVTKQQIEANGVLCQTIKADFSCINVELYEIIIKELNKLPNICLLINNVGVNIFKNLKDITYEQISDITTINLLPLLLLTQKIIPVLKKHPKPAIINMSSFSYKLIIPQTTIYCASKQAIAKFSELLRDYLMYTNQFDKNQNNIQVLNVEPLGISTKFINFQQNFSIITPQECVINVLKALACGEHQTNSHWKHSLFAFLLVKLKDNLPNFELSLSKIYYNLVEKKIIQF